MCIRDRASSVSKAGGASTSSARDSKATICVLPPQTYEHHAQHDRPHCWKGKAVVNVHAAPVQAPSQRQPCVVVDTTAQFLIPDSPERSETDGTVAHRWALDENLLDEDAVEEFDAEEEFDALMEIEPEQGGAMSPAPEALVEEPEQGGIMTPAPEAELENINMASASPALTN